MADAQGLVQCAVNESHPHAVVYILTGLGYLPLLSALIPFCTLSCLSLRSCSPDILHGSVFRPLDQPTCLFPNALLLLSPFPSELFSMSSCFIYFIIILPPLHMCTKFLNGFILALLPFQTITPMSQDLGLLAAQATGQCLHAGIQHAGTQDTHWWEELGDV